jgi:hypothetical protein
MKLTTPIYNDKQASYLVKHPPKIALKWIKLLLQTILSNYISVLLKQPQTSKTLYGHGQDLWIFTIS